MPSFDDFTTSFFNLFLKPQFRGQDFEAYLQRPATRRTGDEASIVDNAIVSPLLTLLGYSPGEQVYNHGKKFGRPDFAPETADFGVCFVVENKSTGIELDLDPNDPESHLFQLCGYLRALGLQRGWLVNGARLMVWRLDKSALPVLDFELDIAAALRDWKLNGIVSLTPETRRNLQFLWEQYRRETFADWDRLENSLGMELDVWEGQALPLGANLANQELLIGAVKTLLQDLQADARRRLDAHLDKNEIYDRRSARLDDDDSNPITPKIEKLRESAIAEMQQLAKLIGLETHEMEAFQDSLRRLQDDPFVYLNTKELLEKTLALINMARERKFRNDKNTGRAWTKYDNGLSSLGNSLEGFGKTTFAWHKRKAFLRHDNRESIEVHENYATWTAVVQETMLGGLDERQRRDEFALQAAYVVFIRLMLIRVCEDKGILKNRLLSDGGLKHWQDNIERYYQFATGNPYEPLLDIAFENAQNIYAHFFTGRELFNWYALDRMRFIRVLFQLSRFNFIDVDADLIGTIYNTYVERPEKKQKGQYYTPPEIVRYILDESGYVSGPGILGPDKRLIDPACGSGTFLVEAARRLVAAYSEVGGANPRQLIDRVQDNLYGFDLNPFACYLSEVNLLIQVLDLVKLALDGKTPPNLKRFHVYNVDALSPSSGIFYFARANTLMAEDMEVVDRIKGRQEEYGAGFGWVVANPPYGAGLTESYKFSLREWWPSVFYGKPDSYVFFYALGLSLLGAKGKLGFITPNTYLMGTNTANLRERLLTTGRITQIVDLPSGIWKDVNVDCALLFLAAEPDKERRESQQTQVYSMDVHDTLGKLTTREWQETFSQPQSVWLEDSAHEMNIRWTPLLTQIEEVCRVAVNGGATTTVQRLGDVTDSSVGIDPYRTSIEGKSNLYIQPQSETPANEPEWKPLLDSSALIGRYEMRWGKMRPHIKYGKWLEHPRSIKYFDNPKILLQDMRNRSLSRRLVACYDDKGFYNRKNFNNIIADNPDFDLKYILALFNSSLLNYWYARQYSNLHINPSFFRRLPVFPADAATQAVLAELVDELLKKHASLNVLREQEHVIRYKRDGTREIIVSYDVLLKRMREKNRNFPVYSLFDARAAGLLRLPDKCDPTAQIARVFTSDKFPNAVVLRANQLWLETDDTGVLRFLKNYLDRPQWKGRSWEEICLQAELPEPPNALAAFFAEEALIVGEINATLDEVESADLALDNRILDLYGIVDPADRRRILGSAPFASDASTEAEDALESESDIN